MNESEIILTERIHQQHENITETPRIWTINFDLDTKSPYYDYNHYKTIHDFLAENNFEYRQHSGDISTCEMDSERVIDILDNLYATYPEIEKCTKSCLFTSVNNDYSFTDIRKEQLSTQPALSNFNMTLEISKTDMSKIFKTKNERGVACKICDLSNVQDNLSFSIQEQLNDSVMITWTSRTPISNMDKAILNNRMLNKYPDLMDNRYNVSIQTEYNGVTTDVIAEQCRIEATELKRLIEYDMNFELGKREYNARNNMLKHRLEKYGFEHIQESGWVSKKGMTDEQVQAILTELYQDRSSYDEITDVMDVSVISSDIYDYMKLSNEGKSFHSDVEKLPESPREIGKSVVETVESGSEFYAEREKAAESSSQVYDSTRNTFIGDSFYHMMNDVYIASKEVGSDMKMNYHWDFNEDGKMIHKFNVVDSKTSSAVQITAVSGLNEPLHSRYIDLATGETMQLHEVPHDNPSHDFVGRVRNAIGEYNSRMSSFKADAMKYIAKDGPAYYGSRDFSLTDKISVSMNGELKFTDEPKVPTRTWYKMDNPGQAPSSIDMGDTGKSSGEQFGD